MDWTRFKGISAIGDTQYTDELAYNLSAYLNWAFLEIGGFFNVNINTSGIYGGNQSTLRLVDDQYYDSGRVWEAFRSNWVYEANLESGYTPIRISGVYVNGSFQPSSGVGIYKHSVNYPLGQLVFDSPIPITSTVSLDYSYKYINISTNDVPWFREFQFNSFRNDSVMFSQKGSGVWNTLSQSRVQLPAIVIEPLTRVRLVGFQLGDNLNKYRYQDVLFHIFAETPWERNSLADILLNQKDKLIYLFNVNNVSTDGRYILDLATGSVNASGLQYPDLVSSYSKLRCIFYDVESYDTQNIEPFYASIVKVTFQTYSN